MKDLLPRARVVVRTSNIIISTKSVPRAARAARLFLLIKPIKSLVCGVVFAVVDAVAFVIS